MNNYQDILQPILSNFATATTFTNQIGDIFGENNDYSLLQQSWLDGTFSLPTVTIVSSSQINNARGGTVVLLQQFIYLKNY
jgi:hypothetical protein